MYEVPGVGAAPVVVKRTDGPRRAWNSKVATIAITPRISSTTPVLLTIDIRRMPMMLIVVVTASRIRPSTTAFSAPVGDVGDGFAPAPPMSWKPAQMDGSTTCKAMAAAATVRI